MLIDVNDIAPIPVDKSGYGTNYPRLIGTMDKYGRLQSNFVLGQN